MPLHEKRGPLAVVMAEGELDPSHEIKDVLGHPSLFDVDRSLRACVSKTVEYAKVPADGAGIGSATGGTS